MRLFVVLLFVLLASCTVGCEGNVNVQTGPSTPNDYKSGDETIEAVSYTPSGPGDYRFSEFVEWVESSGYKACPDTLVGQLYQVVPPNQIYYVFILEPVNDLVPAVSMVRESPHIIDVPADRSFWKWDKWIVCSRK